MKLFKISIVILALLLVTSACTTQKSTKNNDAMDENKPLTTDKMDQTDSTTEMMDDKENTTDMMDDKDTTQSEQPMNQGEKAPVFELMDTTGKVYKLSDYEGQKVYLKFWASWCSICLAGLEEIDTLAGETEDFVTLTVVSPGFNGEKNKEDFIKWFNGLETENLVVLLDEDGKLTSEFGVRGYPTSAYIGSDGVLVSTITGHNENALIEQAFMSIQ